MRNLIQILLFIILTAGFFAASETQAQTVVKKSKKGDKHLIHIDMGKSSGFVKGVKVCFYNDSGKKMACGNIVFAKKELSRVQVPQNRWKKVKKGMEARVDSAGSAKGAVAAVAGGNDARTNFKAFYAFTAMPVTSFNKVSYSAPPSNGESVNSLWGKSEDSGMQEIGLGLEFELGVGKSFSLAFGARYKLYREFLVDSDYSDTNKDQYADTNIKAASLGLWFDFYALNTPLSPNFYFKLNTGLDFDQTNVVILSDRLSDAETDEEFNIVDAKANLTLLSLRVGSHFAYVISPIGFSFGLNLFVPMAEAARSIEGSSDDPNGSRLNGTEQIDDLDAAMAIKKASFGAEIIISTFVVF